MASFHSPPAKSHHSPVINDKDDVDDFNLTSLRERIANSPHVISELTSAIIPRTLETSFPQPFKLYSVLDLANELLMNICSYLPLGDVFWLSRSCKALFHLCKQIYLPSVRNFNGIEEQSGDLIGLRWWLKYATHIDSLCLDDLVINLTTGEYEHGNAISDSCFLYSFSYRDVSTVSTVSTVSSCSSNQPSNQLINQPIKRMPPALYFVRCLILRSCNNLTENALYGFANVCRHMVKGYRG